MTRDNLSMKIRARTIRMRLALIYGGVFLITGAVLLTLGYLLVRHSLYERHALRDEARQISAALFGRTLGPGVHQPNPAICTTALCNSFDNWYDQAVHSALHKLLLEYIGALIIMTGASVALGWWMAGRALAPLRAITATAQRVSGENLGERIALEAPQDELKELADTFDGMLGRLDSAFASQRHFVANASHELRTPLAIMRTEVDVALADPDATLDDLRSMAEALRETIDRSEEPVDLAALVADCITDLHARATAADVEIETDLQPAIARGESALVERLLANLIDNGIRHNVPGGTLQLATSTIGTSVEIRVRNSGPMIDQEQAQTLTEPFRRLSRKPGGFGLGLSIAQSVVNAHRGTMVLSAPEDGGLEITVQLPADRSGRPTANPYRLGSLTKS
jgi:signal transduction histidine kinase